MTSNPLYLISMLLSALIAFGTVVIAVESALLLFRIKNGRVRSFLRLLPFASLLLDLLFHSFSIGNWLNPLNCSSCVQKIFLSLFFPELKEHLYTNKISVVTYFGADYSHLLVSITYGLFAVIGLYYAIRLFIDLFHNAKELRTLKNSEEISLRPILNPLLAAVVEFNGITVFSSKKGNVPMAASTKAIFIPQDIVQTYSQDEYDAIIAHELEHILWQDHYTRLFARLVSALFWWVPTQYFLDKLQFDQEIACDRSILKYGLKEEFLAAALVKVAAAAKQNRDEILCYLSQEKHPTLRRLQMMLGEAILCSNRYEKLSYALVALAALLALLCLLWR